MNFCCKIKKFRETSSSKVTVYTIPDSFRSVLIIVSDRVAVYTMPELSDTNCHFLSEMKITNSHPNGYSYYNTLEIPKTFATSMETKGVNVAFSNVFNFPNTNSFSVHTILYISLVFSTKKIINIQNWKMC